MVLYIYFAILCPSPKYFCTALLFITSIPIPSDIFQNGIALL